MGLLFQAASCFSHFGIRCFQGHVLDSFGVQSRNLQNMLDLGWMRLWLSHPSGLKPSSGFNSPLPHQSFSRVQRATADRQPRYPSRDATTSTNFTCPRRADPLAISRQAFHSHTPWVLLLHLYIPFPESLAIELARRLLPPSWHAYQVCYPSIPPLSTTLSIQDYICTKLWDGRSADILRLLSSTIYLTDRV